MHLEGDLDILDFLDHSAEFVKVPNRFPSLKVNRMVTLHYRVLATPNTSWRCEHICWNYLLKLDLSHSSRSYLCVQWGRLKNTRVKNTGHPAIWKPCTIVKLDDSQPLVSSKAWLGLGGTHWWCFWFSSNPASHSGSSYCMEPYENVLLGIPLRNHHLF